MDLKTKLKKKKGQKFKNKSFWTGRGTDLYTQSLDVVGSVRSPSEVGQVELNLVPSIIQPHWHGADEGLHARRALVVARSESSPDILIIQHLEGV